MLEPAPYVKNGVIYFSTNYLPVSGFAMCSTSLTRASASWVIKEIIGIAKDVSYSYGVAHSYTKNNTETWGTSASGYISAGFNFLGFGVSTKVTGTTSHSISVTTSESFSTTNTTTITYHFQPGVLWQLVFEVEDDCGNSTVYTKQLTQTPNIASPPCCLPGLFSDPTKPHGPCIAAPGDKVYSFCNASMTRV